MVVFGTLHVDEISGLEIFSISRALGSACVTARGGRALGPQAIGTGARTNRRTNT